MNKQQLKAYIRIHYASLFILGFGVFMLFLFTYGGVMTLIGKVPKPFDLPFVTFLVLTLWGLEFFRYLSKIAEETRIKETEKEK